MLTTTFEQLRLHEVCRSRYRRLAKLLGGVRAYGATTPISILQILEHNGVEDASWALRAVIDDQKDERDRIARLLACWCARNTPLEDDKTVWDSMTDEGLRAAVEVAERYAVGDATAEELTVASNNAPPWHFTSGLVWHVARSTAMKESWYAAWYALWHTRSVAQSTAWFLGRDPVGIAASVSAARNAQSEALETLLLGEPS